MEYFLRDLASAQAASGMTIGVFVHNHAFGGSLQQDSNDTQDKLRIVRAPSYGKLLFTPVSPAFGLHLKREIDQLKPDLLHIHLPNPSAFQLLAIASARRIPWVIHWHSDVYTSQSSSAIRLAYKLYRPFEQAMLRRAHTIIATTPPYLKGSLALRSWHEKCVVVPLGIDENRVLMEYSQAPGDVTDHSPSLRGGAGGRANKGHDSLTQHIPPLQILAVGRLTYYKGFDVLLHALVQLKSARLTLIGEGDQKEQLKRLIKSLGIANRVQLLNSLPQSELAEQIACCDCLCLPSIERTEAFGMVLMEAMAHGKAVVATRVADSGMSWVVKDGINGLLAEPGDPESLAHELNKLVTNRPFNRLLGSQGRTDFENRFRIDRVAEQLNAVYLQCISSCNSSA